MAQTESFPADSVKLHVGSTPDALTGTMTVLMKTTKAYTDGSILASGSSYSVTREWGKTAVDFGWASDTNKVLPVDPTPVTTLPPTAAATFVSGLSTTNSAAAATANTTAIQTALNAGGLVQIVTPGTYYINKTLLVRSKTDFRTAQGVKLKLFAGSNCRLIANIGAQVSVQPSQVAIGSSLAVFTEYGHTREVGQSVYIEGCFGNTDLNGVKVITAVSGLTWTCASTNTALTNTSDQYVHIGRYNPIAGSAFVRASNVVTVTEAGHIRQIGDHVYVTGIPVVTASFNGMAEITAVNPGVSWSFAQTAANETGTGTAQLLGDTGILMDIAHTDYDEVNNVFHQMDAINVVLGNIGNSVCSFQANIGGRSRAIQLFNAGMMRFPQAIAYGGKGTLQIESFCNQIYVDNVELHAGTDDVIAWGVTSPTAGFGSTACASGQGNMGVLYVGRAYCNTSTAGAGFKIFSMNAIDLGFITCDFFTGPQGTLAIGDPAVGTTGTVQEIVFNRIDVRPSASANNQIGAGAFSTIGKLSLFNVFDRTIAGSATPYLAHFGSGSGNLNIGQLNLDGWNSQVAQTNISVLMSTLLTCPDVNVSNSIFKPGNGNDVFRVQSNCNITSFKATNIRVLAGTNFQGNFIGGNSGGTVQHLHVANYFGNNRALYAQGGSGSATKVQMHLSNVTAPSVFNDGSTSQSADIYFANLVQNPTGVNLFSPTGSGTIRIKGKGVSHGAGNFCQLVSGTASVSIDCPDAFIDLGASAASPPARLVPLPGDQIWNTNATGGGLYGRKAAGTWQLIY